MSMRQEGLPVSIWLTKPGMSAGVMVPLQFMSPARIAQQPGSSQSSGILLPLQSISPQVSIMPLVLQSNVGSKAISQSSGMKLPLQSTLTLAVISQSSGMPFLLQSSVDTTVTVGLLAPDTLAPRINT